MTGLSDVAMVELEQLADQARLALDEDLARDPSVKAAREPHPELDEALAAFRAGYVRHGVSELRADRAVTVWLIQRLDVAACLAVADAGTWRQPGDSPGGLGGPALRSTLCACSDLRGHAVVSLSQSHPCTTPTPRLSSP